MMSNGNSRATPSNLAVRTYVRNFKQELVFCVSFLELFWFDRFSPIFAFFFTQVFFLKKNKKKNRIENPKECLEKKKFRKLMNRGASFTTETTHKGA